MTTRGWRGDQVQVDLLAPDHLPACPDCGDLAHPTETVCESCGTHLFVRQGAGRPFQPDPFIESTDRALRLLHGGAEVIQLHNYSKKV